MEARKSAKLLAWLIALAVVFTMTLPSSVVWAAEGDASDNAAKIGDQEYATLQAAVDATKGDATIQMLKDVQEDVTIAEDDTITIDLNGKTITNETKTHTITNEGNLTITGEGIVDNVTHQTAAIHNAQGGTVVLNGGTYTRSKENGQSAEASGGNSFYNIRNYGKMTINEGVTVKQDGHFSSLIENGYYDGNQNTAKINAEMLINGGTFEGGLNTIKNDDYGVLTINGGTFKNVTQAAFLNWNEATVTGGTFTVASEAEGPAVLNGKLNDTMDKGVLKISGGTFTAGGNHAAIEQMGGSTSIGDISITGGTFSTNPDKYIADGYLADKTEDGYQIIKEGDTTENVALAGKTYYPTLKEAIDAAEAGDTVTLLKDITVDMGDKNAAAIAIKKDLTLDGNGKTIAANKSGAEEGMGHILGIQGANVKVRDLTIDGTDKSARHGIQVYGEGSKVTLTSVTVKDCYGYGLVVNGATATATRLTTDGNGWGGVNVTKGANIDKAPSFTLNSGTLSEENPIQADNVNKSAPNVKWVNFGGNAGEWVVNKVTINEDTPALQWKLASGEEVAQVNGSSYATIEAAIEAAEAGDTVKLLKNIELSVSGETDKTVSLIAINKDLTLDGNGKTITVKGTVTEGRGHVIGVLNGATVTVKDLTIDGGKAARHGIQTYGAGSEATLENVTVKDCRGYGAVANGSKITANGLYTSGNAWGGVNVSKGSGVTEDPSFVFNKGTLDVVEKTAPIQIDNVDKDVDVAENWVKIDEEALGPWHTETPKENVIVFLPGEDIDKVTLNTTDVTLEVGDKAQLIATVTPESAYDKDVTWSVPEDTTEIQVDADTGVVTAVKATDADKPVVVTATAKDGETTATCNITVTEDADETTTLTVQPSVTDTTMNADDIVTAINNADDADEILVDVPNGTNNVISKDVFAAAKEGKAGKLIIKTEKATFIFDAAQIENAADVNVEITDAKDVDVNEWLPGATTEAIQLTHDGNFPAPATITYTLSSDSGITAGATVYLYYYNDGALELIAQDAITVAEDNSVTFTLAHASAYVFSTEKVEAATVADNVEQAIKAIGTVTYTDESKDAIEKAREQYDLFVAQYADDKDLVTNLKTLTDAEAAYKALDDEVQAFKAEFDAFYDGVDGTMTYDQQKQVPELEKAYNALNQEQKDALGQEYADKIDEMDKVCEASQNAEIVSQANRVSKAVAEKLPTNVAFTTAVKSQIDAVRALYDSVVAETPDAKVLLTSELEAIEKAEAAYKTAKRAAYSSAKISLSTTKYTYNGKAKRPTVKGLSAFVNGTDYTIAYKSNVKSGKATVTVTGKGDCAGLSAKTATFRIVPNKAAISKLTKGKRNMKVRIKSQKKAAVSGYQIAYKYGKSGKYKKVTTTKLTKKIRKLKTKKYYYVKVRAYKKIDGKKYYGTYSKIKKIKVR